MNAMMTPDRHTYLIHRVGFDSLTLQRLCDKGYSDADIEALYRLVRKGLALDDAIRMRSPVTSTRPQRCRKRTPSVMTQMRTAFKKRNA